MEFTDKLEEHEARIQALEKADISKGKDIESLCKQLEKLVQKIDKFTNIILTGVIGGAIGLIFFLAQQGLK